MQSRKALMMSAAAVALTMSAAPQAQAASSYVSLFGGASFLQKPNLKGGSHTHSTTYQFKSLQSIDTSFKTGFVVGGNWGVDWGNFRTELELAYRQNSSSSRGRITTSYWYATADGAFPSTPYSHTDTIVPMHLRLRAYSLMANVWYDFHDVLPGGWTPYVGGGIGGANVQLSGTVNSKNIIDSNEFVFAWQLGAGISVPITDSVKAFLDYRYFAADGAHLMLSPGFHGGNINADFDGHTVLIGFRLNI